MNNKTLLLLLLLVPVRLFAASPAQRIAYEVTQSTMNVPIYGVSFYSANPRVVVIYFKPEATTAQRNTANVIAATVDISTTALDGFQLLLNRISAYEELSKNTPEARIDTAIALVAMDEINILRQWETSFKAAVAASSSLSDLKSRVAALDNLPDRTPAQVKAAIKSKIENGGAE